MPMSEDYGWMLVLVADVPGKTELLYATNALTGIALGGGLVFRVLSLLGAPRRLSLNGSS